ncbi:hypothetical protein HPB52_023868 [Rhipicephalus sanguineus]|uniref:SWIM-type domain-containing protein n=1 Tax=Rhipicephalus sanguineus TaxID=34632 RepID=A0A9D4PT50_RHISA|nr:hypothetical protein HPB52_023868 [Rhipicephalus sanguineus]
MRETLWRLLHFAASFYESPGETPSVTATVLSTPFGGFSCHVFPTARPERYHGRYHRRSCSASAASLVPTSYEELRLCQTLQANSATIVSLSLLRMAQSVPLQQPTSPDSKLAPPVCSMGLDSWYGGAATLVQPAPPVAAARVNPHIVAASCTCKAGCRGWCKHAAALAVFVNKREHTSCTDLPCAWLGPPARPLLDTKKKIKDLFPGRPLPTPTLKPLCATVMLAQFPDLRCSLRQILDAEDCSENESGTMDTAPIGDGTRHTDPELIREILEQERSIYHMMEVESTLPLKIRARNIACPLPAVTPDEQMYYTSSRRRGRDDEGSDCDAPRKHVQPEHNPSRPETHGGCDALPRPAQLSATVGGMLQPSMAAPTPKLPQHSATAFLKETAQLMTVNSVRKKKGKSKRRRAPSTPQLPEKPAINDSDTETASQSPCPKEVPRSANGTASSQPHASDPAPEDFTLASSLGVRRRARALASSPVLPADPAVAGTVLFKPSAPNGAFMQSSPLALASALSSRPSVMKVRVNSRQNIVAADVSSRECIEELLGVTELCGIPVSARLPADRGYSTGYLHSVEGDLTDDELLQSIQSSVPLVSAARNGYTVTLRFAGAVPPDHVSRVHCNACSVAALDMQQRPAGELTAAYAAAVAIPLQRAAAPDLVVSTADTTTLQTLLPVVNGKRNARWRPSRPPPRSHFEGALCEPWYRKRITRSFRRLLLAQPPARMLRPSPAHRLLHQQLFLNRPAMKQSAAPMAQLRDDPRDAIIASLQLTVRAVGELLPSDSPLKAFCLQAGGLQNTPSHHG